MVRICSNKTNEGAFRPCYGRYNDRGAMFVADIVLYDYNRAATLLFGANATTKISVIHLAALICSFH